MHVYQPLLFPLEKQFTLNNNIKGSPKMILCVAIPYFCLFLKIIAHFDSVLHENAKFENYFLIMLIHKLTANAG